MKTTLTLLLCSFMLGCGSHGSSGTDGGGGAPDLGGPSGPESYTIQFDPLTIPAGTERTQCIVRRLGNPAPLHVGSVHNVLGEASHHMVVYRVGDTAEQTSPFDCQPFQDTLTPGKGSPIMITQKHDDLLTMPSTVGYTLDANQMIRMELHYINATAAPVTLTASTTMTAAKDYQIEASFLLIGDPDIVIPPSQDVTLGPVFYPLDPSLAGSKFFALTGHEHKLGTDVKVAVATGDADPGTMVYDVPNWTWSEPATVVHDPPITISAGGGFRFTCKWHNPETNASAPPVKFGESANDEMCFFWAYYYPSKGTHVCLHSEAHGGVSNHCLQ
jgi:Copper type II ascorbate-dependent monooxygenase, C-terminal domain